MNTENCKKISIIVPFYNSKDYISNCIDSIISQTYKNYEIIFVDDGSSDFTDRYIEDYLNKKNFSNYKILKKENEGPGIARNYGINNSNSDYIAFIDSDDVWKEKHLELLFDFLEKNSYDFAFTNKGKLRSNKICLITFRSLLIKCSILSSTMLFRRTLLRDTLFRVGKRYSEDYDLWLRLAAKGTMMYRLPVVDVSSYDDKPTFGKSGLSKNLYLMEKNELENYHYCLKKHYINFFQYLFYSSFSLSKYLLRLIRTLFN